MKNIIIISDTHGRLPKDYDFWEILNNADLIIHLGDGYKDIQTLKEAFKDKFVFVYGNCDFVSSPKEQLLEIEEAKIFITHGHEYKVKSQLMDLQMRGLELGADCCLYGHTHRADISDFGNIKLINPGSLGAGRTYCYMTVIGKKILAKIVDLRSAE